METEQNQNLLKSNNYEEDEDFEVEDQNKNQKTIENQIQQNQSQYEYEEEFEPTNNETEQNKNNEDNIKNAQLEKEQQDQTQQNTQQDTIENQNEQQKVNNNESKEINNLNEKDQENKNNFKNKKNEKEGNDDDDEDEDDDDDDGDDIDLKDEDLDIEEDDDDENLEIDQDDIGTKITQKQIDQNIQEQQNQQQEQQEGEQNNNTTQKSQENIDQNTQINDSQKQQQEQLVNNSQEQQENQENQQSFQQETQNQENQINDNDNVNQKETSNIVDNNSQLQQQQPENDTDNKNIENENNQTQIQQNSIQKDNQNNVSQQDENQNQNGNDDNNYDNTFNESIQQSVGQANLENQENDTIIKQNSQDEQQNQQGQQQISQGNIETIQNQNLENSQNNLEQDIITDPIELNFECCQNCQSHNWMVWHDEKFYNKCFIDTKKFIKKVFVNALIFRNKGINNPKIGSFEITHRNNVIWSKKNTGKFPNKYTIAQRVKSYLDDLKNKRDIKKYSQSENKQQEMQYDENNQQNNNNFQVNSYKTNKNFNNQSSKSPGPLKSFQRRIGSGSPRRLRHLNPQQQIDKENKIFKKDSQDGNFIIDVEVCQGCENHQTTFRHNPMKYNGLYENLKTTLESNPSNKFILKKNRLSPPRMGAFEIKHKDKLLFSKIDTLQFPQQDLIVKKVLNYKEELNKGEKGDIKKYTHTPQFKIRQTSNSPRNFKKSTRPLPELLGYKPQQDITKKLVYNQNNNYNQQQNSDLNLTHTNSFQEINVDEKIDLNRIGVDIINGDISDWELQYIQNSFEKEGKQIHMRFNTSKIIYKEQFLNQNDLEQNINKKPENIFELQMTVTQYKFYCSLASKYYQQEDQFYKVLEQLIILENIDDPTSPRYKTQNDKPYQGQDDFYDENENQKNSQQQKEKNANQIKNKQNELIKNKIYKKKSLTLKKNNSLKPQNENQILENEILKKYTLKFEMNDQQYQPLDPDHRKLLYTLKPINLEFIRYDSQNNQISCTVTINPPCIQIFQEQTQPLNQKIIEIDEGLAEQILTKEFLISFQNYEIHAIPLKIECNKLLLKPGAITQVFISAKQDDELDVWSRKGSTELGEINNKNPNYFKKLQAEINRKEFKFEVIDTVHKELIGQAEVNLTQIINEKHFILNVKKPGEKQTQGQINIQALFQNQQINLKTVQIKLQAKDLKGNRKYDDMNPFLKFVCENEVVYITETCKDTLDPQFLGFSVALESFCQNDLNQTIEIQSWNDNTVETYKLGSFQISLRELLQLQSNLSQNYFSLKNNKKEVGKIIFSQVQLKISNLDIPQYQKEEQIVNHISLALSWVLPNNVDMLIDAQFMLIDQFGEFLDFVGQDKQTSNCGSIQSQIWKKKECIYAQEININFETLKPLTHGLALFICSRKGHALHLMKDVTIEILMNNQIFYRAEVNVHKNYSTGCLTHVFTKGYKDQWQHHFVSLFNSANNYNEKDVQSKVIEKLNEFSYEQINPQFVQQCRQWQTGQQIQFTTADIGIIPNIAQNYLDIYVQNSYEFNPCIILASESGIITDIIQENNYSSKDQSVKFQQEESDLVKFEINFAKIQYDITEIWLYIGSEKHLNETEINIIVGDKQFTSYNLKQIQDIQINKFMENYRQQKKINQNKKYFCLQDFKEFQSKNQNLDYISDYQGLFAYNFRKDKNQWAIMQKSYFTETSQKLEQENLEPIVQQILRKNLTNIKEM